MEGGASPPWAASPPASLAIFRDSRHTAFMPRATKKTASKTAPPGKRVPVKKAPAKKSAAPVKRPPPRPRDFTEALGDEICDRLSLGESLIAICRDPRLPDEATVYRWLRRDDLAAFRDHYARARENQAHHGFDEIEELANAITPKNVAALKCRIEVKRWRIAKLHPRKYGDKPPATADPTTTPTSNSHERTEEDLARFATLLAEARKVIVQQ